MEQLSRIKLWLQGSQAFQPDEEHLAFQFQLVLWLLLCAVGLALLLQGWLWIRPGSASQGLAVALWVYVGLNLGLWWWLRGHRQHLTWVSWCALVGTVMQNTATWFFSSGDELRVLWFFTGLCAAYTVVGPSAGAVMTVLIQRLQPDALHPHGHVHVDLARGLSVGVLPLVRGPFAFVLCAHAGIQPCVAATGFT